MPILWTDPVYLVCFTAWCVVLWLGLVRMLKRRRARKTAGQSPNSRGLAVALSVWSLLGILTACEAAFVLFVDHTDAFNMTNVSKRWFARHIDAHRNRDGFRDRRELTRRVPENVTRVLFFGDSFTIGHGIRDIDHRFTDLVEKQLNLPDGPEVQVDNLGEAGWDVSLITAMVTGVLQQKIETDVIVYVYMMNDIEGYDPRTEQTIKEIQSNQPTNWLVTKTYFLNWLYFRWQHLKAGTSVDYFPHLADSYRSAPWEGVRKSIQRMNELCRQSDVEFRMVVFPFLHNLGPEYPFAHAHEKIVACCRDEGISVLDLDPLLTPRVGDGLVVNAFDNHPNEHCHSIVADAICRQLLDDLMR